MQALVVGWVRDGHFDTETLVEVVREVPEVELTIHRAIDHVADYGRGWQKILQVEQVTSVLTAGSAAGVEVGMDNILTQAANPRIADLMMIGGGLRLEHIDRLKAAGIRKFHVGSPVRGGSFNNPVDPDLVRVWVEATR